MAKEKTVSVNLRSIRRDIEADTTETVAKRNLETTSHVATTDAMLHPASTVAAAKIPKLNQKLRLQMAKIQSTHLSKRMRKKSPKGIAVLRRSATRVLPVAVMLGASVAAAVITVESLTVVVKVHTIELTVETVIGTSQDEKSATGVTRAQAHVTDSVKLINDRRRLLKK